MTQLVPIGPSLLLGTVPLENLADKTGVKPEQLFTQGILMFPARSRLVLIGPTLLPRLRNALSDNPAGHLICPKTVLLEYFDLFHIPSPQDEGGGAAYASLYTCKPSTT